MPVEAPGVLQAPNLHFINAVAKLLLSLTVLVFYEKIKGWEFLRGKASLKPCAEALSGKSMGILLDLVNLAKDITPSHMGV